MKGGVACRQVWAVVILCEDWYGAGSEVRVGCASDEGTFSLPEIIESRY